MSEWSPDVVQLAAFDDGEWLKVERSYAGRLLAYVSRRVLDIQAREDIVQECFLGAVRGIQGFDSRFTFEQYLFGICRNRTIDHLRRRKALTMGASEDDDGGAQMLENLMVDNTTPSGVVRGQDLRKQGAELLAEILKDWVQETFVAGEFKRLMVIEALFSGGWRNRDTWQRFELRDETAVAGIKFRALKRLRDLAQRGDPDGLLVSALAEGAEKTGDQIDVAAVWRASRASCPARHWLARHLSGSLEEGPKQFVQFHLDEMDCAWCQANRDDLAQREESLEPILERVRASTAQLLRSRATGAN